MPKALRRRGLVAAATVIFVGLGFLYFSTGYRIGVPARMGAGFFPMMLSGFLVAIGILMMLLETGKARDEPAAERPNWRAIALLPGAILLFALLIDRAGLVPATFLAVLLSTFADPKIGILRGAMVSFALTVFILIVFQYGLGIQARAFR